MELAWTSRTVQGEGKQEANAGYLNILITIAMKGSGNQDNLNEYTAREAEIEQHIEGRGAQSDMQAQWVYEKEVRELLSRNKYKYQDVVMHNKIGFLQDMKQLIYDLKECPEDIEMFTTNSWKLVGFEEKEYEVPQVVPSNAFLKKVGHNGQQFDDMWGRVELEGRVNIKLHQISYNPRIFNLRRKAICFYPMGEPELQERQELIIEFNETVFNGQSENEEYFSLRMGERLLKIKKDGESKQLIKLVERILFLCLFRGAYCLRNEVPAHPVEDYVIKEVDTIKGIDFVHENKIKEIVGSRYYKEAIGGFFYLLNKESFKRKVLSMELTFPKWLKQSFREMPDCDLHLVTNVIPNKIPLMNLKIKLHESEVGLLSENLKYIFPFRREFVKRSLVVYESDLQDNHVNYIMNQISYPMHMIGLPKNQLSLIGLEYAINAAGTLCQSIIDFSYNSKLISISGPKIFGLTNANPSLKKLILKGCYVSLGEEGEFFEGLASNMCLKEFQIDYMDSYNDAMIKHLGNYDGEIY